MPRAPSSSTARRVSAHRRIGIVERQRRHERRETIRIPRDELGHAVVGRARQIDRVSDPGASTSIGGVAIDSTCW